MVNSFILKGLSDLYAKKDAYGIITDTNGRWQAQNGKNNVNERKKRFDEFLIFIGSCNDSCAHNTFQG